MTSRHATHALIAGGVLLALYPAVRPWGDMTVDGAGTAFASVAWPLAHLAAVAGFALVAVGLLGLRDALSDGPGAGAARGALGTWWLGTALVLPYYGAEAFALHTLGTRGDVDPALVEAIRMGAVQVTVFGVGLAAFAVAGVLAAVAVLRSGVLPRWEGAAFAVGFALYLPQFFAAPELRIAHGVLVAVGCVLLGTAVAAYAPPGTRSRRVTSARAASSSSGG
jgi:hypothetical protein